MGVPNSAAQIYGCPKFSPPNSAQPKFMGVPNLYIDWGDFGADQGDGFRLWDDDGSCQ